MGCGSVGAPLVALIATRSAAITARTGLQLEVAAVAVRSLDKARPAGIDPALLTDDAAAVVADPSIDIIVELIGGVDPARSLITASLRAGKPVITGNKALIAAHGAELFAVADAAGVDLLFEAAVAGGIPFIRPLRESLAGEHIARVMGIVNGTTNFILTQMTDEGADYAEALAEAQALGYAEADPTADVEGHDAAAKAAIIASIAYGVQVTIDDVTTEGISQISATDIEVATRLGYVIKLLAVIESHDEAGISARVHPTLVPVTHPLASVRDSFNAVFVEGRAVGDLMFYGRGAGGDPTASAVLGDLIDAATNRQRGTHATIAAAEPARIMPSAGLRAAFYMNLDVADRPGVLATVAGALGARGVSIRSMEQTGLAGEARLLFITHEASEEAVAATLADLDQLDEVGQINSVLRVLGDGQ